MPVARALGGAERPSSNILAATTQQAEAVATTQSSSQYSHYSVSQRSIPLDPQLQRVVPYCAWQCLATFLNDQFDCPPDNLSCLCRESSSEGFSLGEIAYGCALEHCERDAISTSILHTICPQRTGSTTTSHSIATTSMTRTMTTRRKTAVGNPTTATPFMSTTTTATGSPPGAIPPSATASTLSSGGQQPKEFTSGQVIGITTAIVGVAVLALCCFWLSKLPCLDRFFRRQKDRNSWDFVDHSPSRCSSSTCDLVRGDESVQRAPALKVPTHSGRQEISWPQQELSDMQYTPLHEKALEFDYGPSESPQSMRSVRTLSALLPDKPGPSQPPKTLQAVTQKRSNNALSVMTTIQESPPPQQARNVPYQDNTVPHFPEQAYIPYDQHLIPSGVRQISAPEGIDTRQPSWPLPTRERSMGPLKISIPATSSSGYRDGHSLAPKQNGYAASISQTREPSDVVRGYIPNMHAGQATWSTHETPVEDFALPKPSQREESYFTLSEIPHENRRFSIESDATSIFEMADEDGFLPIAEQDNQWTDLKVASPLELPTSPIRDIQYPKVPRRANQQLEGIAQPNGRITQSNSNSHSVPGHHSNAFNYHRVPDLHTSNRQLNHHPAARILPEMKSPKSTHPTRQPSRRPREPEFPPSNHRADAKTIRIIEPSNPHPQTLTTLPAAAQTIEFDMLTSAPVHHPPRRSEQHRNRAPTHAKTIPMHSHNQPTTSSPGHRTVITRSPAKSIQSPPPPYYWEEKFWTPTDRVEDFYLTAPGWAPSPNKMTNGHVSRPFDVGGGEF